MAGSSTPTTRTNPTIGSSTPIFGAVTTTKALPAQTWHKVPLNNSSDDFSHWSETMRLALNNWAPWPMADGSKCGPQNPVPNADSTNDHRDSLASWHQGDSDQHAALQIPADKQYRIGTSRGNPTAYFASATTVEHALKMQVHLQQGDLKHGQLVDARALRITHSHRSWLCHSSPLARPTITILSDSSNVPATGTCRVPICMRTTRQQPCAVLQATLHVPDSLGNPLSAPCLL
jgi:hypothetical protein